MVRKAIIVCALWTSQAVAANPEDEATRALLTAAVDSRTMESAQSRSELIARIHEYCFQVGQAFPRNSPAEDAWLKGEIGAGGDRAIKALGSEEFRQSLASRFAVECVTYSGPDAVAMDDTKVYVALALIFNRIDGNLHLPTANSVVAPERFAFEVLPGSVIRSLLHAALSAQN